MPLNDQQLEVLFRPLNPTRVANRKGMSYLETWDVLAHLNRVFGFDGWDKEVTCCELVYEEMRHRANVEVAAKWDVAYRATVRLTVKDPNGNLIKVSEDVATGQAQNQPSRGDAHDLAIKSAVSDALKRAAKDLGNQFGLSLYDSGSLESVVGSSLAYPPKQSGRTSDAQLAAQEAAARPLADQLHDELPTGVLDGDELEAARQAGLFEKP